MAHPSVPVKSVKELIALARSARKRWTSVRPGTAHEPSGDGIAEDHGGNRHHARALQGYGTSTFGSGRRTDTAHVRQHIVVSSYVKTGRPRGLAVSSAKRSTALPRITHRRRSGRAGYVTTTWHGWLAPAGTPAPVVQRLSVEIGKAVKAPDVAEKMASDGGEPVGSTPEQFRQHLLSEIPRWRNVVQQTGLRIE